MVRTGTGSITIAAAGDFATLDSVAPGAVYTAGYVADNAAGFTVPTLPTLPTGSVSNGLHHHAGVGHGRRQYHRHRRARHHRHRDADRHRQPVFERWQLGWRVDRASSGVPGIT